MEGLKLIYFQSHEIGHDLLLINSSHNNGKTNSKELIPADLSFIGIYVFSSFKAIEFTAIAWIKSFFNPFINSSLFPLEPKGGSTFQPISSNLRLSVSAIKDHQLIVVEIGIFCFFISLREFELDIFLIIIFLFGKRFLIPKIFLTSESSSLFSII